MTERSTTQRIKGRSPKEIERIIERGTRILELRKKGASLRAIAKILHNEAVARGDDTRGYSYANVRKHYENIMAIRAEEQNESADEIRALCVDRLEMVVERFMPHLEEDGTSSIDNLVRLKMKAGDVIVRAVREIAEIYGVKRPQKLEVTGEDGKPLNLVTQVIVEFTNDVANEEKD